MSLPSDQPTSRTLSRPRIPGSHIAGASAFIAITVGAVDLLQATPRDRAIRQTARIREALREVDADPHLAWEVPAPPGSGLAQVQAWLVRIGHAPRYVLVAIWPSGGFVVAPEMHPDTPGSLGECLAALPALESDPTALTH